jgi:hypothetical protein
VLAELGEDVAMELALGRRDQVGQEKAAQSRDLLGPALTRIFDAHRQMLELRAAQKLNAGLLDANGSVLLGADHI